MKTIRVGLTGISPLLMHSPESLDPMNPLKVEMRKITSKQAKKRTEADEVRLLEIDFLLSLYHNGKEPVVPEMAMMATIRNGARRERRGQEVMAGVMVEPEMIPLSYDGPKMPDALFKNKTFRDVRRVVNTRASVLRCRPRFNKWGVEFDLLYDPGTINSRTLKDATEAAGRYVGLLDFRPRFGRFEVTKWQE